MQEQNTHMKERGPVVAIMGHIDHGKSTLLSYLRQSKKPLNEAGGITQHISAYEVEHTNKEGKKYNITFVDTPGHEAFCGIRKRGASVADIVILVVSAEDGVKQQTIEARNSIIESGTPYIVAINKIDKPGADIEKTKQNLAENEVYLEGYGGDIPFVAVSAKTGEGVPELFDLLTLVAELHGLTGNPLEPAEGVVIESNRDIKKGISATCIIKNGYLEKGMFIASGTTMSPLRMIENYLGKPIDKAGFPSPVKIIGWDELPAVGKTFKVYKTRDEARAHAEQAKTEKNLDTSVDTSSNSLHVLPIVVKADTGSSLEAIMSEIRKIKTDRMCPKIISSGIGNIGESDVRLADGTDKAVVIGFNAKVDAQARNLADRNGIEIVLFDIIYKMNEWIQEAVVTRTPKMKMEEVTGTAKILKTFSKVKDRQVMGGKVLTGSVGLGNDVKIIRRENEIGSGKIKELQQQKAKTSEVHEGNEFGTLISCDVEIAVGDIIQSYITVEK
ncbi:MAG: translation initiation factor IF-2 [Patescibacteria group bacterium]